MKKITILTAIAPVALASAMFLSYAGWMGKGSPTIQEGGKFISAPVETLQGEDLGSIRSLITNPSGEITFAILSHGGILGIGKKELVVPFEALTYQDETNDFILDVNKERLASAPEFQKGTDLNDYDAAMEVYQFYGFTPPWEEKTMNKEEEMERLKPINTNWQTSNTLNP